MGFTGQPDDAEKLRLIPVVGDSLGVSHKLLGVEITTGPETRKIWPADYDMIQDFDFQKLAGADEVTRHFDVGFRWGAIS
jgi:hypothetical protein